MKFFANMPSDYQYSVYAMQQFFLVVFSKCVIKSLGLGSLKSLFLRIFNMKMLQH